MAPVIRVAVCGSTLYMAGLAACLKANPDVEVLRVSANAAALLRGLDELAPAVVAFDLGEMPGDLVLALLRDRPEVILVGVDPSSDRLLLLSGRQAQPVSAAELLQVIRGGGMGGSPPDSRSTSKHAPERSVSQDGSN